jgi:hypothetical protein
VVDFVVMVYFVGGWECMTLFGYEGLAKGSVISPFLYNIIGSCVDRFLPSGCGFLQYADDLVVYMTLGCFIKKTVFSWNAYPKLILKI